MSTVSAYHLIYRRVVTLPLKPIQKKLVLHGYEESLEAFIQVYSLEEIIAEKLRAILQHRKKLESRGWARSRARDYYDLWRIFSAYQEGLDLEGFSKFLQEKCFIKEVTFQGAESFFPEIILDQVEATWEQWLGPLVPDLPPFQKLIQELRPYINKLF